MINERIRAGADAIKMLEANIGDKAYRNALASERPEESLRTLVLASLESNGVKRTTDEVWRAVCQTMMGGDATDQTCLLLDVLRDPDIAGAPYDAEILTWVQEDLISASFRRPALLEYTGRAWKNAFTPEIAQKLWSDAFRSFDDDSARRLLQQVPVSRVPYLQAIAGKGDGVSHAAVEVFAQALTDRELAERVKLLHNCLDGDSSVPHGDVLDRNALQHLMLLTLECTRRFGVDQKLAQAFFQRLDKHIETYTQKMYAPKAAELAQLALAVGAAASPALSAIIIAEGHKLVPAPLLAALVAGGMPVFSGEGGWRKDFLLNVVETSKRRALADAMNEDQRREYMMEGIGAGVTTDSARWDGATPTSCTDEDLLDVLHAADFGVGRPIRFNDVDPAKWVHEWMGAKDDTKRYAFVKLHVMGLLPADLQYAGHGPLNYAAYKGDVNAIEALAKAGYDIEAKSHLHYANAMEEKKQNEYGCTPLLLAAKYDRPEAVKLLLKLGADVGVKSGSGAGIAQMTKSEEIKRMLKSIKIGRTVEGAMKGDDAGVAAPKARKSDIGLL